MISPKTNIHVLFISAQPSDIREIKEYLQKSDKLIYHVEHRPDFFGSSDLLADENTHIDVILLDLGMFGSDHSREIFRRMVRMAHGIPIIVFTDRENHNMAIWAMEDGAADNITRGDDGTDIFKFRNAIDFSLARAEVAKSLEERNQDTFSKAETDAVSKLQDLKESTSADMDRQKDRYSALVRKIIDRGDEDIVLAVREISEALGHSKFENSILMAQLKKLGTSDVISIKT